MPLSLDQIICGDCLGVMASMEENSVDSIITDPPYGLEFMGKEWDKLWNQHNDDDTRSEGRSARKFQMATPQYQAGQAAEDWHREWAKAALRVAKPGALMLAFGGTRTHHRLMCAIEDAGWEIRDTLMWLHGQGFPKSSNHFWSGYGTALKPAFEPIVLAMKPLDGTFAQNAEKWGVAGLWIEGGRIGTGAKKWESPRGGIWSTDSEAKATRMDNTSGRWPANVLLEHSESDDEACAPDCPVRMLDEMSGDRTSGARRGGDSHKKGLSTGQKGALGLKQGGACLSSSGGASRYFYCGKAPRNERFFLCRDCDAVFPSKTRDDHQHGHVAKRENWRTEIRDDGSEIDRRTWDHIVYHPTQKPLHLMEYLCKLTKTPTGGIVLDPFAGTGSTCIAATNTGRPFIGIEKDAEYCRIAEHRLSLREPQLQLTEAP